MSTKGSTLSADDERDDEQAERDAILDDVNGRFHEAERVRLAWLAEQRAKEQPQ